MSKQKVLIVGGGFGGVKAALELADCADCEVTLMSDHSHFRYYPALYHAATGGRRVGSQIRLKDILEDSPIKFVRAEAKKLDRKKKQVKTADGKTHDFDTLIIALGSVTNYFDIKGLAEHSFGIKSIEEVDRFKTHLHKQFVDNACPDPNYIIVGGGPTGVELAGALPGYLREVMKNHNVKECPLNITLVEAAPTILPRSPKSESEAIAKRLKALGVKVKVNATVKGQTTDALMIGDKPIKSRTVVWTAGVANHPFFKDNDFKLTNRGKVAVDEYMQAGEGIYVIGDNADTPFSGFAQTALYDGDYVAETIKDKLDGRPTRIYKPKKPISVIPVGTGWASVVWGKAHFSGMLGWILRLLADFVGYNDLESWPKAGKRWIATLSDEDLNCPNCMPTQTKNLQ